jgi:hypothetical protein
MTEDQEQRMSAVVEPKWTKELDWESWAGEIRVNFIRLIAILMFYSQHLLDVMTGESSAFNANYHLRATVLSLTWGLLVIAVYVMARIQRNPPHMKYITTSYDILMIAATVKLTEGYLGVWNMIYLLPITATALRHSLRLVYFATGLAIMAYVSSLSFYIFLHIGTDKYWSDETLQIRTTDFAVVLLSMLTTGMLAGQTIRQARRFGNVDRRGV